jgi:hypothetical protein
MKKNVFLAMALLALMAVGVFAQTEGDFNVDLTADESGVIITGYTGSQRAVTIPAKIQGYPVKMIGNAAFSLGGIVDLLEEQDMVRRGTETRLTSVTIPTGVVRIGREAFAKQSTLTSVSIPVSVTSIGAVAFADCSSLTTINIPASVTSIGAVAFADCSKLAMVNFSEGLVEIGEGTFARCSALKTIKLPNSLTKLGESVFAQSGLTAVTLGTGLTVIPSYTFSYKRWGDYYGLPIKTIVIPEGVTKIGNSAFSKCTELTAVTLPSTLQEIGDYAFSYCSALTTVTIPAALEYVRFGSNVFAGCDKLLLATRAALQKLSEAFPQGFVGSWRRDNFNNTLTITTTTIKSSSENFTWTFKSKSGDKYILTTGNYTGDGITIKLVNSNLEISGDGDSGPNDKNWNGTWRKQ